MQELWGGKLKYAYPSWSPDGKQIAVADKFVELVLVNADGSGVTVIGGFSVRGEVSWLPDGKQVAFYADQYEGARWGTYVASIDGSSVRVFGEDWGSKPEGLFVGYPRWSPDGKHVAFLGGRSDSGTEIYVAGADGSDVRQLTDSSGGGAISDEEAPLWSPDGMEIAYTRRGPGGGLLINVVSADGSEVRELTDREIWPTRWHGGDCEVPQDWSDEMGDFSPVWSPDGTQIVFSSDRDCDLELFVMNADGSEGRQLTYNDTTDVLPSWTR